MPKHLENYANHYAAMSDDDLVRLSLDVQSLVPQARTALKVEMERRQVAVDSVDWSAQPSAAAPESKETSGAFLRFLRNFLICVACAVVYLIIAAGLFSVVPGIDIERAAGSLTTALLKLSVVLAILTTWRRLRLKTVWIVGLAGPAALVLLLLFIGLFRRTMG
jgi:hypothetical protein